MFNVAQLDTGLPSELGVQTQYLDRKGDLVDHALAGRLHLAPQFQIFWPVVEAITVFVVNVLTLAQVAAKYLCHDYAVFKRLTASPQMQATVSSRVHVTSRVYGAPTASFVAALSRTKTLLVVVVAMLSVSGLAKLANARFTTEFALKRRWGSAVHVALLASVPILVKETF